MGGTCFRRTGRWLWTAAAATCIWSSTAAWQAGRVAGADKPKATTDPAQADADYRIQGEYAGVLSDGQGGSKTFGLQVVALGDGRFDAWLLDGGLPGNGWDRQGRKLLKGLKTGETAALEAVDVKIVIDDVRATATDAAGRELGQLRKVRRESRTLGAAPPPEAIVLFDGRSTDEIKGAKITPDGLLDVGGLTARPVRDFRLHVEFLAPYMPEARGQARGNSGVYIQQRYEVQVLDSFGLASGDNDCGSVYRQTPPDLNMCFPPLVWQTYDIEFRAARFDAAGAKIAPARLTVRHNGVPIHADRALKSKTGAGQPEGPEPRPILLQNHGDPVRFRNLWLVELDEPSPPTTGCERRGGPLRRLLGRRCRC